MTSHAFLYSGGVVRDINPPGAVKGSAWAINESGLVAGDFSVSFF